MSDDTMTPCVICGHPGHYESQCDYRANEMRRQMTEMMISVMHSHALDDDKLYSVINARAATDAKAYERDQYLIASLRKQLAEATRKS